jgi:hypothetical protein
MLGGFSMVEIASLCSKKAYTPEMMNLACLSKETHVCKKQQNLSHCLPLRI